MRLSSHGARLPPQPGGLILDPDLWSAAVESGLADRYRDDWALLDLYMRKLIKPGWPGQLDDIERRYRALAKRKLGHYVPTPPVRSRFRRKNDLGQPQETPNRVSTGSGRPLVSPETSQGDVHGQRE